MSTTPARHVNRPDAVADPNHEVGYALEGIDLPLDKAGVIAHAESNGASAEAIARLNQMPDGDYNSMPQILSASCNSDANKDEDAD